MAQNINKPEEHRGSLISLEGDPDTVTTQLRLLPSSSRILILPPLASTQPRNNTTFNARLFVRDIHEQLRDQFETARSFLQLSTTKQPRLVFMNGGSVGAVVKSITAICRNVTNGAVGEAEDLFHEIVKDGVAGLEGQVEVQIEKGIGQLDMVEDGKDRTALHGQEVENYQLAEHPNLSAMKAADSLDRATAALQRLVEDKLDGTETINIWHSATSPTESVPNIPRIVDSFSANETGDSIRTTIIEIPNYHASPGERRIIFTPHYTPRTTHSIITDPTSHEESMNRSYLLPPSPQKGVFTLPTPRLVEFGEACIVEVQPANDAKSIKRAKSVACLPSTPRSPFIGASPDGLKRTASVDNLTHSGLKIQKIIQSRSQYLSGFERVPRKMFVRASQTITTRTPAMFRFSSYANIGLGADVQDPCGSESAFDERGEDTGNSGPFKPIFPIYEDLIIHFNDTSSHGIFESVIRSYKNNSYPFVPSNNSRGSMLPSSSSYIEDWITESSTSRLIADIDANHYYHRQKGRPYSWKSLPLHIGCVSRMQEESKDFSTISSKVKPPTPTTTPLPIESVTARKFYEITIPSNAITAVDIQNSLRSALNTCFPLEAARFRQHTFAINNDRLWKPMFHSGENFDHGATLDQIIAVGCEDGVAKEFFDIVSAQVENLGSKKRSLSRTSKLDIRYLITLALQTFAFRSLSIKRGQDPLTQPTLLASLLIPQLEAYLSSNESARFLILHYPASHLSTVLALRKLLGTKLMRVAGVIDSLASEPSATFCRTLSSTPSIQPRSDITSSPSLRARKRAPSSPIWPPTVDLDDISTDKDFSDQHYQQMQSFSFSSADFVLPSTASDHEISTFISTIRACLIEKSPFYIQERRFSRSSTCTSQTKRKFKSLRRPAISSTAATTTSTVTNIDVNFSTPTIAISSLLDTDCRERELEAWEKIDITVGEDEDEEMNQLEQILMPRYRMTHEPLFGLVGTGTDVGEPVKAAGKSIVLGKGTGHLNSRRLLGGKSFGPSGSIKALKLLGLA